MLAASIFPALGGTTPTTDALLALPFVNGGLTTSAQMFANRATGSIYLEPEAPLRARWAWADGSVTPFKDHEYLYELHNQSASGDNNATWSEPPLGMRSAPPLGGLSTGTLELRADGTLSSVTIENASPAGSAKMARLVDGAFGARWSGADGHAARLLRTHPPKGIPGVDAIEFSGAQPFTRLRPIDASLPSGVELTLFGRSRWRVADMEASATPAAGFTLTAVNPSSSEPLELSFFLSLPLQHQAGMVRPAVAGTSTQSSAAPSARACAAACAANATCAAWSVVNASAVCSLSHNASAVPPAANSADPADASGVRGEWARAKGGADCLTLHRPGTHAAAGNVTLCGSAEHSGSMRGRWAGVTTGQQTTDAKVTFGAADSLAALWASFAVAGSLDGALKGAHAAAAVTFTLPPGGRGSATIALGWYFPWRDFMGETIGNRYATLGHVGGSEDAARLLLDGEAAAKDTASWSAFASALIGPSTSLPAWLGDTLLNSLHHTRSVMWLADGRWRQWESFSCVNVDSVHNDGERHIPYLHLWPEGVASKMRAWAKGRCPTA